MGFSSGGGGGGDTSGMFTMPDPSAGPAKPSFMDHLGDYLKQRYPIAGAVAGQVMPGSDPAPQGYNPPPDTPGMPAMPQAQLQDYSGMVAQNAQPKSSGALKAILSLIA